VKALRTAAVLAALVPLPAAAACGPDASQSELDACAAAGFRAADRKLNGLYAAMKGRLKGGDAGTTRLLTLSQRAWVAWRDAECDFAASGVAGGSVYPTIRDQCLTELTAARIADFRHYLDCEEGDLSCPLPP
jgi:uncharacterized protein YecT (DUF1311 family)